jgi:hypothetical protein
VGTQIPRLSPARNRERGPEPSPPTRQLLGPRRRTQRRCRPPRCLRRSPRARPVRRARRKVPRRSSNPTSMACARTRVPTWGAVRWSTTRARPQATPTRQSAACASFGWCSVENFECKALTDRDCVDSDACRNLADCYASNGQCGPPPPTDEQCAADPACRTLGYCSAYEGRCGAKTDADCARSVLCTGSGLCKADAGQCVLGCKPPDAGG